MKSINFNQIKGDFQGGLGAGVINLFQCVPFGLIAFAPLGGDYANFGIMSSIIASIFAGFFASLFGGSPGQITGPGAAISLVFSYIIVFLMHSGLFDRQGAEYLPTILTLTFFTVSLSGLFQILFGLLKADYLIKFVSYPVIAGIMTGAGLLIIQNELWSLLGISDQKSLLTVWDYVSEIKYGNLFIGIFTTILLKYRTRLIKGTLGFPLMIAIGAALYYFLLFIGINKEALGGTFGEFTFDMPIQETLSSSLHLIGEKNFFSYLPILTPLALNLAILCSLLSLLSALSLKVVSEKSPNSRQELIGQGIGNMMSGFLGGIPSCGTYSRSVLNYQEGGTTKLSGIVCSLTTLLLAFFFSSYFEYLPKAVISGIVITLGINSIDSWTVKLFYNVITRKVAISKEVIANIGTILAVILLIFSGNFIPAIGIGVLISILLFLGKMRGVLIKRIYENQSIPSKKIDNESMMLFLAEHRQDIKVIELTGMIYFGSAEKLSMEIERLVDEGVIYIILDMKKVEEIDLTGARVLEMTYQTLKKQGKHLGFSYLEKGRNVWLFLENVRFFEKIDPSLIFTDTDRALQYFEELLFANFKDKKENVELKLSEIPVFHELTESELEILQSSLQRESYKEGDIIFKQGDKADAMFFISKGSIDVLIAVGDKRFARTKRVQSLSSGTFFGEMALLQKGPRTATVIASSDLICYRFSFEKFQELVKGYSHLSVSLLTSISRILSKRLTFINQIISEMEW